MSSGIQTAATLDDLMRVEGKAELIGGRIVHLMSTAISLIVAFEIAVSLATCQATGVGAGLHRRHRLRRPAAARPPVLLARCRILRRAAAADDALHPRGPDVRRRGPQRERLRPGGRGRDGRQAGRLLRGRHARRLGRRPRGRDRRRLPGRRRRPPSSTAGATSPRPSRRCRDGGWTSTRSRAGRIGSGGPGVERLFVHFCGEFRAWAAVGGRSEA